MNAQTRNANLLLAAVLLAGGAAYGISGMEPDDSRTLAYTGYLENGSAPQSGTFQLRFGLFASENADDSCLLTGPTDCTLWSEEQSDVQLDSGVFSVVLGEATALSDTVLAQTSLYLGIAVQGPADAAFTVVGKQKLQMVPFAARAAAAKDYKVTGDLTVGNDVIATGEVQGASADFTGLMASGSVDTGHIDADTVELNMGNGGVAFENSGTGLDIRALSNPSSGEPLFRVLSSGYAERLRVDHDGTLFTEDNIDANGNINGESMTSEGSISGTQLNVGSPSIDADATLNVEGNVNMIGGTFDGSGLYGLSNGPSGTATTDGFIVYWAYRALAGSHLRMSGESPINTRLIYNSHRVEAGDITVNGMFPVRKGETWMVRNMTSNAATINYAFIALGQ